MTLIQKTREAITNIAKWETSPTDFKQSIAKGSALYLAKKGTSLFTGAISSTPVVAVATAAPFIATALAYSSPQVRVAASLIAAGTTAAATGLWFFRRNHNAGVKAGEEQWAAARQREAQSKEQGLKTSLVRTLGGEAAIAPARIKPVELVSGLFDFREESFPADKAIVKVENSKKYTVYGLRIQDKVTKDVYYASVSYVGAKLQIVAPEMPVSVTSYMLEAIASRKHNRYELVPPQGKELTLLQERVNRMEPKVQAHDVSIARLEHSNAELQAKVETLTELVTRLTRTLEAQTAKTTSQDVMLEVISPTEQRAAKEKTAKKPARFAPTAANKLVATEA